MSCPGNPRVPLRSKSSRDESRDAMDIGYSDIRDGELLSPSRGKLAFTVVRRSAESLRIEDKTKRIYFIVFGVIIAILSARFAATPRVR